MVKAVGNTPDAAPLRWTISKGAREFGLTIYLLTKQLKDGKEEPDSEGCYSTLQLTRAIYGSLHTEQLRRTREQADRYQLENEITRGQYLNKAELMAGLSQGHGDFGCDQAFEVNKGRTERYSA
jgi:hypothetical protein